MYRILSLDGGGIRGLLTTRLLEKLNLALPGFLDQFDLFAGTSTGAIPALGLAAGFSPAELSHIYQHHHREVFKDSFWDNLKDGYMVWGANYSHKGLQGVLANFFGDRTLGDLKKRVLIPTVHLDNKATQEGKPRYWKAKFFHNFPEDKPEADIHHLAADVALRSTAAPVYFPLYQGYIDGGLAANNPSLCALVQAIQAEDKPLNDIMLLSLGTGKNPKFIPEQEGDWGLIQWAYRHKKAEIRALKYPLVEMMFEVNIGLADYQCKQLLKTRYHRLDPLLPGPIDLDDCTQIGRLNKLAGCCDIRETITWLKNHL